ncbi:hypothetical protein GUI04_00060, partial [Xanthomonas citri pv. citri]|nr:hypothetical protein [Xanthomonas citri pv. citri]
MRELTNLPAVPQQSSSGVSGETTEESQNEDVNNINSNTSPEVVQSDCENHLNPMVSRMEEVKPVRKLKLICKQKPKENTT